MASPVDGVEEELYGGTATGLCQFIRSEAALTLARSEFDGSLRTCCPVPVGATPGPSAAAPLTSPELFLAHVAVKAAEAGVRLEVERGDAEQARGRRDEPL